MANRIFTYLKSAAPTVNDDTGDGYFVGDMWLDETNDAIYQVIDVTAGAAVWKNLSALDTSGSSYLTSDFNITGATTVFQDTGLSVSLPAKGTYLIQADVRTRLQVASGTGGGIYVKLYNSTDAADVSNSTRMCIYTTATAQTQNTAPVTAIVTVTAAKTIKLYAARTFDGTLTSSDIAGVSANGITALTYIRIS